MEKDIILKLGDKKIFKTDYGPISFGWVLSGNVVSWSGNDSKDLLIGRCWEGLYLYPTENLDDNELNIEPIKVCSSVVVFTLGLPVDWNKDGQDDLIVSDRRGFLYFMKRKGKYPDITFDDLDIFTDKSKGLKFNIPYENPNYYTTDDLEGYTDSSFFNITYPLNYPGNDNKINLIIGDWAGNLWWMPDISDGKDKPEFQGVKYCKTDNMKTKFGKDCIESYGNEYVKPEEKICDENGQPYLLGEGFDAGNSFKGGNTRPVLYKNDVTGSLDILVLTGMKKNQLYYLTNINKNTNTKPVFQNLGEIELDWSGSEVYDITCYHSRVIIHNNGWNDILITMGNKVAVFKNKRLNKIKPEFQFDRWISDKNVTTSGYNFTEILTDVKGKRYLLDNPTHFELRELNANNQNINISSKKIIIKDENGVFKPEGETDPQGGKDWGFHRATRWDFDGSGKQHLIVGTDKGLLYLLIEEDKLGTGGEYKYKSVGPLKDNEGEIIRIHNRACASGIDLNGDGVDDLVLGGVTYQLGFRTDPDPGGGFYYIINRGLDEKGVPILEKLMPLKIEGHEFDIYTNSHIQIQTVDFGDENGKQIILAVQRDGFKARIFKPIQGQIGLKYTGRMVEKLSIEDRLLDIHGDGSIKFVFGGGEQGIAYYQDIIIP